MIEYHERDSKKDSCRWCYGGRECRFFDADRDRVLYGGCIKCPFYEDRTVTVKLEEIGTALRDIAERLGWLS